MAGWRQGLREWQERNAAQKREAEANAFADLLEPDPRTREVLGLLKKQRQKRNKDRIIRYTNVRPNLNK